MKNLLLYVLIPFTTLSQPASNALKLPAVALKENKLVYAGAETVTLDKGQLFENAQKWYRHNFESADNTLTINNIDDGTLSGTGIIHAQKRERKIDARDLFFTIDFVIKNGSYEYTVHRIYSLDDTTKIYYSDMYSEETYPPPKPRWPEAYRRTMLINMDSRILGMIAKLKTEMARSNFRK